MTDIPRLYTVSEVAELLHIHPVTVTARFQHVAGVLDLALPGARKRVLRIPAPVLRQWCEARGLRPEIEPGPVERRPERGNAGGAVPLGCPEGRTAEVRLNFAKGRPPRKK